MEEPDDAIDVVEVTAYQAQCGACGESGSLEITDGFAWEWANQHHCRSLNRQKEGHQ